MALFCFRARLKVVVSGASQTRELPRLILPEANQVASNIIKSETRAQHS